MDCKFCKRPISEHPVGRETDACVAQAMGWHSGPFPLVGLRTNYAGAWLRVDGSKAAWRKDYQPTTSRAAAMQVWEGLPLPRLLMEFPNEPPVVYTHHSWNTHAETLELAICHAALTLAAKEGG